MINISIPHPTKIAVLCEDEPEWTCAIRTLGDRILLDTETSGFHHDRRLRLIQVGSHGSSTIWLMPQEAAPLLMEKLTESVVYGHFLAFDLYSLTRSYEVTKREADQFLDTMVSKALRAEAICTAVLSHIHEGGPTPKNQATLAGEEGINDSAASRLRMQAEELGWGEDHWRRWIPGREPEDAAWLRYAAWDIVQLDAVRAALADHHTKFAELAMMETAVDLMYHRMAAKGIKLNLRAGIRLEAQLRPELHRMREEAQELGLDNPNSPQQVVRALQDAGAELTATTARGSLSASAGVLQDIAEPRQAFVIAQAVLAYRRLSKMTSMVSSLLDHGSRTGRVHPDLRRIGARTGRSSCRTPNLQQIEKRSGDTRIRGLFLPEPGETMVSSDYHNIEVRAIADLAGDLALKDRLMDGADIHGELAADVFGRDFTPEQRGRAKVGIFAMLYGASDRSIAAQTGMSVHQAEGLRGSWAEHYPMVAEASAGWTRHSEEFNCTILPNGWVIEAGADEEGQPRAYQAINHMIQGHAAFIFRRGVVQLHQAGLWRLVRMVIHDEFLLSTIDPDEIRADFLRAGRVVTEGMEYPLDWTVHGTSWG